MILATCSGEDHYFNAIWRAFSPEVFGEWNRKCDCGKHKLPKKELAEFKKRMYSLAQTP